jgi:hypothetical protein
MAWTASTHDQAAFPVFAVVLRLDCSDLFGSNVAVVSSVGPGHIAVYVESERSHDNSLRGSRESRGPPAPRQRPRWSRSSCRPLMPKWRRASGLMPASTTGTCVVGTVGDGGLTLDVLANEQGFATGRLGVLFVDHDKTPICPTCRASLKVVRCAAAPSWSRTTSGFRARRSTAST